MTNFTFDHIHLFTRNPEATASRSSSSSALRARSFLMEAPGLPLGNVNLALGYVEQPFPWPECHVPTPVPLALVGPNGGPEDLAVLQEKHHAGGSVWRL